MGRGSGFRLGGLGLKASLGLNSYLRPERKKLRTLNPNPKPKH